MTTVRSFNRQVRPVRIHLAVDRGAYLCGYVRRPADPEPSYEDTPVCGPCVVAFRLFAAEYEDLIDSSAPPDLSLITSVSLLHEAFSNRFDHLDLDRFVTEEAPAWEQWRRSGRS